MADGRCAERASGAWAFASVAHACTARERLQAKQVWAVNAMGLVETRECNSCAPELVKATLLQPAQPSLHESLKIKAAHHSKF